MRPRKDTTRRVEDLEAAGGEDPRIAQLRAAARQRLADPEIGGRDAAYFRGLIEAPAPLLVEYGDAIARHAATGFGWFPDAAPEVFEIRERIVRLVDEDEANRLRVERDLVLRALRFKWAWPRAIRNGVYHTSFPSEAHEIRAIAARKRVDEYAARQQAAVDRIIAEREAGILAGEVEPVTDWHAAVEVAKALARQTYAEADWYEGIDQVEDHGGEVDMNNIT